MFNQNNNTFSADQHHHQFFRGRASMAPQEHSNMDSLGQNHYQGGT